MLLLKKCIKDLVQFFDILNFYGQIHQTIGVSRLLPRFLLQINSYLWKSQVKNFGRKDKNYHQYDP